MYGQLGLGNMMEYNSPTLVNSFGGIATSTASGGIYHSLVLLINGTLFAFGSNSYGQLGVGTTTDSSVPIHVLLIGALASTVTAGGYHSLSILQNGSIVTFGNNGDGELGRTTDTSVPMVLSNFKALMVSSCKCPVPPAFVIVQYYGARVNVNSQNDTFYPFAPLRMHVQSISSVEGVDQLPLQIYFQYNMTGCNGSPQAGFPIFLWGAESNTIYPISLDFVEQK